MKSFASGMSPTKRSILKVNNISAGSLEAVIDESGVDSVVSNAPASGIKVYGRAFRNDIAPGDGEGVYDYLADPTIELQYFFDQIQVQAIDSQFPATASGYLQSSCRPRPGVKATDPRFNMTLLQPGALAKEIMALQTQPITPVTNASGDGGPRKRSRGWRLNWRHWMAVGFAILVVSATMLLLAWFAFRRIQDRREERTLKEEMKSFANIPMLKVFSHAELVTATNNFSETNRLGKGGFGTVYKGELPDGRIVAVKKLHVDQGPKRSFRNVAAVQQLMNEVNIIGSVQHRNVVPLEGLCTDKEFLLVYAYMPHGSLQDALFEPTYRTKLDWKQWCNIAVGTAKGLAYLHEECEHKIIHRDIKPANVLLDAKFNPRLADFGLARNMHVDETHVTSKLMGSIGYIAPDYATSGQLSEKSDAYSYGVLLLTIMTGQRPTSKGRDKGEDMSTVEWVKKKAMAEDELLTVVDQRFDGNFDPSEALRFLSTSLLCAQNNPATRPAMSDVVQMLLGKTEIPPFSNARDPQDFFVDLDASFLCDTDSASMKVNASFGTCSTATTTNRNDTNNIIIHTGIQEHRAILEDLS